MEILKNNKTGHLNKGNRIAAMSLFLKSNITYKEIGTRLDISEKTIGQWAKEDKWKEKKNTKLTALLSESHSRREILAKTYEHLKSVQDLIIKENRKPTSGEADIILKLTKSIETLTRLEENTASYLVKEYAKHLRRTDKLAADKIESELPAFLAEYSLLR